MNVRYWRNERLFFPFKDSPALGTPERKSRAKWSAAILCTVFECSFWHQREPGQSSRVSVLCQVPPPPLVVPHPLSFPRGGWGTVTWSTQNFSLRLIVLLCG